jgi:tetrahydromethanopterin S-methyltransferase subunit E
MVDPMIAGLGVVALMGAAATISGAAEDLESDVGSMSNPNSQVQLAPQMGNLHRFFNKAISGEPVMWGAWCGIAGSVAFVFIKLNYPIIMAMAIGSFIAALIHSAYAVTAYLGRTASQSQFNQPLYLDIIVTHLGPIAGHGFIATFGIVGLSYLMTLPIPGLAHPFPLPLLAVIWGITMGAIGSSTGDNFYGSEVEYQHLPHGGGIPVASHGDITTKAGIGARNNIDVTNICSKFAGPTTGLAFGLIVFLSFWITIVFGTIGGIIAGIVIIVTLIFMNRRIELFAKDTYGPYRE